MSGVPLSPLLQLTSPLGDDTLPIQVGPLHAIRLQASERLSRPFEAIITVVCTERAIDPDELLFRPVGLTIRCDVDRDRFLNGIVQRVESVGMARRDRWEYRLIVVPMLWFLSQTGDCRIFQQKTVAQILQQLFTEHRVQPVEFRIFGDQPVREYTTQFNETDLEFAHRLLQEAGYFYYFEHSVATHRLIVTDRNQSFRPLGKPVHWVIHEGRNVDVFSRWGQALRTASGEMLLLDYDPLRPSALVRGEQTTTLATAGAALRDTFRWTAMTMENQVAADRARYRIEADEAAAGLRDGVGYDASFVPGTTFTLARDPFTEAQAIEHAIHGVEHSASDDSWIAGGATPHYENHFTCFLNTTPWREPLDMQRPAMAGTFSAIVLGNSGEEIHTDPLGRIKVRLLFDRRRETVASMATWVRVVQPWAGNRWGWQNLPRVGTEVAVSFMNGDPDVPVVLGGFYHQEMPPPFPLPGQQTRQGFRSRSTPHGGSADYSELSFDDRKGAELVLLHAQRDLRTEIERDAAATIGRDQSIEVERDHSLVSATGSISMVAQVGTVDISSATRITLRVGATSLMLTEAGLTVTAPSVSIEATEVNISAATVTTEAAEVNIAATSVGIEAPEVTIATAEFIAPPPGL